MWNHRGHPGLGSGAPVSEGGDKDTRRTRGLLGLEQAMCGPPWALLYHRARAPSGLCRLAGRGGWPGCLDLGDTALTGRAQPPRMPSRPGLSRQPYDRSSTMLSCVSKLLPSHL